MGEGGPIWCSYGGVPAAVTDDEAALGVGIMDLASQAGMHGEDIIGAVRRGADRVLGQAERGHQRRGECLLGLGC